MLPADDSCRILHSMHFALYKLQLNLSRANRAKWLIFFSFLALLTTFDTFHNYVAHRAEGAPTSVALTIQSGIGYWLPYFFLVPAAVFMVERYPLNLKRIRSFVIHGVAGMVFNYVHILIAAVAIMPQRVNLSYGERLFFLLGDDFSIDYLLYCSVVVAAYMLRQYSELKRREVRDSQLETVIAQTHLRPTRCKVSRS